LSSYAIFVFRFIIEQKDKILKEYILKIKNPTLFIVGLFA